MFAVCSTKDGIDVLTYEKLQTTLSLWDLCKILEMHHAHDSWKHADLFESDRLKEVDAQQSAMKRAFQRRGRR